MGFGAIEFIDFELFHRRLGIDDMVSIEHDANLIARCTFNQPFRSITPFWGEASDYLPTLDERRRHIVWLDYVSPLTSDVIADCETAIRRLRSGSLLLVTLNAHGRSKNHSDPAGSTLGEVRLGDLQDRVSANLIPSGVNAAALEPASGLAGVQWAILSRKLRSTLQARLGGLDLYQFVNFSYKDGARMQTIGWFIGSRTVYAKWARTGVETREFARTGQDPFNIALPPLTDRELLHLSQMLPCAGGPVVPFLPGTAEFAQTYRYYPSYSG